MTVIRPNSISGITSITAQSGSLEFYDATGSTLNVTGDVTGNLTGNVTGNLTGNVTGNLTGDVNSSGVSTISELRVGTGGTVITTTAGGSVGIGTENPAVKLDILDSVSPNIALRGSSFPSIRYSGLDGITDAEIYYGISGNDLVFNNVNAGPTSFKTNNIERLRIDSSGRVTTPYQPMFQAYGTAGGTYVSGSNCIYPSVVTNIGNHYNTSNGIFTVPVSGTYYFNWSAIGDTTNDVYRYYILVNNSKVSGGNPDWHLRLDTSATGTEYGSGDRSIIITLSQNDTVRINYIADSSSNNYPGGNSTTDNYNTFGGFLIG